MSATLVSGFMPRSLMTLSGYCQSFLSSAETKVQLRIRQMAPKTPYSLLRR